MKAENQMVDQFIGNEFVDEIYEGVGLGGGVVRSKEFEGCHFVDCDFRGGGFCGLSVY